MMKRLGNILTYMYMYMHTCTCTCIHGNAGHIADVHIVTLYLAIKLMWCVKEPEISSCGVSGSWRSAHVVCQGAGDQKTEDIVYTG